MSALLALWVVLAGWGDARAAPEPPARAPAKSQGAAGAVPSSRAVAEAPLPDESDGVVVAPQSVGRQLLWVPRILLYLPRRVLGLVFEPMRSAAFAWERLRIPERFKDLFFNETGTFGIFPVALVDTGFGLNAGVRLVHRDLFGAGEGLQLRASFGGRYDQLYGASMDSGRRLGRFTLRLRGGYDTGRQYRFYGIGNGDEVPQEQVTQPIDPLTDDTAVMSRYRKDVAFGKLALETRIAGGLSATVSLEGRYLEFGNADEDDFANYFQVDRLVGVENGTADLYPQLRLTFDNRVPGHRYMSEAMSSDGFYLNGWLGYAKGFGADPSNHLRYAADLQWFVSLFRGDRVLVLRLRLDGVTGQLDEVPFVDLPALGGSALLRGYHQDRFRDRVSTLASAEYQYNLSFRTTAYLFVDTGRVWRSLSDFAFEGFRMGYGGGLLMHSRTSFFARLQLASSLDGGFFVNFSLDPVHDTRRREGTR